MENIIKNVDILKDGLPINYDYLHNPIRIKTYKVSNNNKKEIIVTDGTSTLNLVNYINELYNQTTRKKYTPKKDVAGYTSYDGNYIVVVENGTSITHSSITKNIFGVRDIELPEEIEKKLEELQEHSKCSFDENLVSRYAPIIYSIANKTIPTIIKDNEYDLSEFYDFFLDSRSYINSIYENDLPKLFPGIITPLILMLLLFASPYGEASLLVRLIFGYQTGSLSYEYVKNHNNNKFKKNMIHDVIEYDELCRRIIKGDIVAIEELSDKVNDFISETNIYKNEFYFKASKDMMILNCYNDESLTEIKTNLLSLICEYIQYHSIQEEDKILEELFNNKLKEIEEKINLSSLTPSYEDKDTIDFLSLYCESIDNNKFGKLIPVAYDPKLTYEIMQDMSVEETPKIKVK